MGSDIQQPSGRVIALGRLLLAALFLIAVVVDVVRPRDTDAAFFALLGLYVAFAVAMVMLTWSNWWRDASHAGPAHAFDILIFTLLVLLTEGYNSPFFTFFMFLLLSAAIRWGWQETTLTALLLILLFLGSGYVAAEGAVFELQRFLIRTGHLVILSLILIWFGINRWGARANAREEEAPSEGSGQPAAETVLRAAMRSVRARRGAIAWQEGGDATAWILSDGEMKAVPVDEAPGAGPGLPFLYDLAGGRGLNRDPDRNLRRVRPSEAIGTDIAVALGLSEGLALPVRSETGEGMVFLESVPNLSLDHLDLGEVLAGRAAERFRRHALLAAAEASAEARTRVQLARDLHDSVVQFLAGAGFRLEAMKRSVAAGRVIDGDLNELQQLMIQEQGELRSFITALRGGLRVSFNELARDLRGLADRLCRQWQIECEFNASASQATIPARLQLDTHQLVREAVANAARHAGAKKVSVTLAAEGGALQLKLINDGAKYPRKGEELTMPKSLQERVELAAGNLEVSRGMGVTKVSIKLPIGGGE